jgi:hypothetical protein
MTVREFAYQILFLNNCLTEFPQPEGAVILTVMQIKNIVFRAIPQEWQTNFVNANIHLNTITLPVLIDYMTTQKGLVDAKSARFRDRERISPHQFNHNGGKGNGGYNNQGGQGCFNNSGRHSQQHGQFSKRHKPNKSESEYCKIHQEGSHSWNACFGNPNGPNFKPHFVPQAATGGGHNGNGNGNCNRNGRGNG